MKLKPPTIRRPYHVNYLQGFWLKLISDVIKSGYRLFLGGGSAVKKWLAKRDHTLTIRIRWVVAGLLLLALFPRPTHIVYGDPISPAPQVHKVPLAKKLPETSLAPLAALEPIPVPEVPEPVAAPQPAPAAPVGVTSCGSDPMMAYIYTVESGCRSWAINPGGCIGLGQACPGGKLPCGLYDWACQDSWFRNYAVSAYGSIYNAYIFRQSHNWW